MEFRRQERKLMTSHLNRAKTRILGYERFFFIIKISKIHHTYITRNIRVCDALKIGAEKAIMKNGVNTCLCQR